MGNKLTADMLYDLDPKQIREAFLYSAASIMSPEKYKQWMKVVNGLSDDDLFSIFIKSIVDHGGEVPTEKEILKDQFNLFKSHGIMIGNTEYGQQSMKYIGDKQNEEILSEIKKSSPSDIIYLRKDEDAFIQDLWEYEKYKYIPSDLFFAKTIPITDCKIVVDETADAGGRVCEYRVVIFSDYESKVDKVLKEESDEAFCVGAIIPEFMPAPIVFPIVIMRGIDGVLYTRYAVTDTVYANKMIMKNSDAVTVRYELLSTWYGIQIALLHPAVKDVFRNPQRTPVDTKNNGKPNKDRKRKVKYIRKHVLTMDKLESVSGSKEQRKINRKCLAWYVIGHWRTYKSGKKIFIMPYWKGVLRDMKKNAEGDEREREINIEWEVNKPTHEQKTEETA